MSDRGGNAAGRGIGAPSEQWGTRRLSRWVIALVALVVVSAVVAGTVWHMAGARMPASMPSSSASQPAQTRLPWIRFLAAPPCQSRNDSPRLAGNSLAIQI